MTALDGAEYLVPQHLRAVAGRSPLEAGLWLLPGSAGLTAPISVLGTALAVGAEPAEKTGAAAATGRTAYDLGLALGIAITGTLAVAAYLPRRRTPFTTGLQTAAGVSAALAATGREPGTEAREPVTTAN
ncbi:hypothetical protein ACH4D3_35425 [Streptomyces sp. NPDC018026]|uniref:hypothetical protein n=1 Tax=Streptomyces sp. NPDC018026 TaxID=3365031 RepID=UPI003789CE75